MTIPLHKVEVIAPVSLVADELRNLLAQADAARQDPAAQFSLRPPEHPDADESTHTVFIQRALQHLVESVPNGQFRRTSLALGVLRLSVQVLESALYIQSVDKEGKPLGLLPAMPQIGVKL